MPVNNTLKKNMNQSPDKKSTDQVKPGNEIRMGREVPIVKNASSCDSEKDAKCSNKKEKELIRENRSSSLV